LIAPSGECLGCYKPRAVDCSRLMPRAAASCLAKLSCYTWPACRYLCCPAWQLVDCVHCKCVCHLSNKELLYFTYCVYRPMCYISRDSCLNCLADTTPCCALGYRQCLVMSYRLSVFRSAALRTFLYKLFSDALITAICGSAD